MKRIIVDSGENTADLPAESVEFLCDWVCLGDYEFCVDGVARTECELDRERDSAGGVVYFDVFPRGFSIGEAFCGELRVGRF